jgi:hypothetical protein
MEVGKEEKVHANYIICGNSCDGGGMLRSMPRGEISRQWTWTYQNSKRLSLC